MKSKGLRSVVACLLVVSMVLSFTACRSNGDNTKSSSKVGGKTQVEKKAPVEITFMDSNDQTSDQGKFMLGVYKKFQEKYADQVKLTIESTPNLDAMIQKVKLMYASGSSPDLFNANGYDIVSIGATGDKIVDLKPYLDADPELKSWTSKTNIDFNTRDGKMLSIGLGNVIAMWYNKEIFKQVGITPGKTWDEFWSNCDKLKAAGVTPMSMDTKDQAWITNLFLGAIIGSSNDAGNKFMTSFHPKDYNTPEVVNALKQIQKCFQQYSPKNAAGADYNAAANSFLTGKTAMIFNGPWMIGDFNDKTKAPEGFSSKVATCLYPNESVYTTGQSGYVIGNNGKDKADAAMKFIKFMQSPEIQAETSVVAGSYPDNPMVVFTDAQKAKAPLLFESISMTNNAKLKILQNYQSAWYTNVCDEFTVEYPNLIFNKITPTAMAQKLTEIAQKNK